MSDEPLISYAQNGEDVVLWRALGHVADGIYVDVGGWDPDEDSVTRLFYEHGWRGIDIEPVPEFAAKFRRRRPDNEVVQVAITDEPTDEVVLHRFGTTGLSTVDDEVAEVHDKAGLEREDITVPARRLDDVLAESKVVGDTIHFLKIDVEGAEPHVVRSLELERWRPWVLVIEATEPNSSATTHHAWEPVVLAAGYVYTLFDGLSRYYVAPEHPELVPALSYPACSLDDFVPMRQHRQDLRVEQLEREVEQLRSEAGRWRNDAVSYWAEAMARVQASADTAADARHELDRLRIQLARARATLQEVRADRKKLRARVKRMGARADQAGRAETPSARPAGQRLRAAVKKVTGA